MVEENPPPKPPPSYGYVSVAVIAVAAVLTLAAAWGALVAVERVSRSAVERGLFLAGEDWASVDTNGLQVILSGDAPSEAARFAALSAAGHEIDGARVIDQMALPEAVAIEPPGFSVEMLRNEAGISLIGLIPAETDREALAQRMRAIDPVQPVADFLEVAEFPTPEGWDTAVDFSLDMAALLPRSKISVSADHVAVEAIAASADQKREWEQVIRRQHPAGLRLALDIRAPLDVVSPYIVRFLSDEDGARFDACTAYTPADRNKIISAGIAAGVKGAVDCTIGLGVPSPDWPDAVARGIRAVGDMGGGSLTFSDADITLIAPATTPQETFDRVIGELEADLPDVFSLHGVLSEPEAGTASPAGTPEFIASLAQDGAVQLRGRVASEQDRTIVETLARAHFGTKSVYAPLRLDPGLPASWAVRTLAGLEALDQLAHGRVVVRPDIVTISGTTGQKGASAAISRLLSEKLGEAEDFRVNVTYEEKLDPIAALPSPQECVTDVNAVMAHNKITFAPGSAEIERDSAATVDKIAEILKTCPDVAMEIGGYTDSQGREEMNQALSQRRAEAVVSALLARRVLTTNLKAFGHGENFPIADNDTEEGREANRRIEFSLVGETRPRAETGAEDGDAPTIRPPARPDAPGDEATQGADGDDADEATPEADADAAPQAAQTAQSEDTAETGATEADAVETGATGTGEAETGEAVTGGTAQDGTEDATAPEHTDADGNTAPPEDDTAAYGEQPAADDAATGAETAEEAATGVTTDAAEETAYDAGREASAPEATAATGTGADDTPAPEPDSAGEGDQAAETPMPTGDAASASTRDDVGGDAGRAMQAATDDAGADTPAGSVAGAPHDTPADTPADPETDTQPDTVTVAVADTATDTPDAATTAVTDGATEAEDTPDALDGPNDATDPAETGSGDGEGEVDGEDIAAAAIEPAPGEPVTDDPATGELATDAPVTDDPATAVPGEAETAEGSAVTGEPAAAGADADADADADAIGAESTGDSGTGNDATDEADPQAADPLRTAPSDIPAIRPRARPPIVVHPDLEGVRPRPRPANVPDAPSTE